MIIKARGFGIAVPVIPVIVFIITGMVTCKIVGPENIPLVRNWMLAFIFFFSAGLTYLLGRILNYERLEKKDIIGNVPDDYVASNEHTFMVIPIQYWALPNLLLGVVCVLKALKIF